MNELYKVQQELEAARFELAHLSAHLIALVGEIASKTHVSDMMANVPKEIATARQTALLEVKEALVTSLTKAPVSRLSKQLNDAVKAETARVLDLIDRVEGSEATIPTNVDGVRSLRRLRDAVRGRPDWENKPKGATEGTPARRTGGRPANSVVHGISNGQNLLPQDKVFIKTKIASGLSAEDVQRILAERIRKRTLAREKREKLNDLMKGAELLLSDEAFIQEQDRILKEKEDDRRMRASTASYISRQRAAGKSEEEIQVILAERAKRAEARKK